MIYSNKKIVYNESSTNMINGLDGSLSIRLKDRLIPIVFRDINILSRDINFQIRRYIVENNYVE